VCPRRIPGPSKAGGKVGAAEMEWHVLHVGLVADTHDPLLSIRKSKFDAAAHGVDALGTNAHAVAMLPHHLLGF
jgi:hypothetical protein